MKKLSMIVLVLLAVVSAVVAVMYFTKAAANLPHFFPGYLADSARKHTKHGLAFAGLAVVLILGAWMVGGQNADTSVTDERPDA